MIPKKKRLEDPHLLAEVRTLPCMACIPGLQRNPTEPHHVTTRGAGGDDVAENVMPLCVRHHAEWHQGGPGKMCKKYPAVRYWLIGAERSDVLGKF